jgi:hypothetical protein
MKSFSKIITISLAIASMLCFAQCKKDNNNTNPVDRLPPATQTGAGTFGCLINGQVFTPASVVRPLNNQRPDFSVTHEYYQGGYTFGEEATDQRNLCICQA